MPQDYLADSETEWEVEKIVDYKTIQDQPKYLIKWKGFQVDDDTGEPEKTLGNAPEKLRQFLAR